MIVFKSIAEIWDGIAGHFPIRRSEWVMAVPAFGMWAVFQISPEMFENSPSFGTLAAWADESVWAIVLLTVGVVRLGALTVNGTFRSFRFSPHLRMLASIAGLTFWSQWTLGIVNSYLFMGGALSGVAAYGTFCLMELLNTYTAAADVGVEVRRIQKRGSGNSGGN